MTKTMQLVMVIDYVSFVSGSLSYPLGHESSNKSKLEQDKRDLTCSHQIDMAELTQFIKIADC